MTPAEANQERRDAAIRRGRAIDALEPGQLANFIHRLAAIVPGDVDRVLAEFAANTPKPRAEKLLHPVTFGVCLPAQGISVACPLDDWHVHLDGSHSLPELERLIREHSGIEP